MGFVVVLFIKIPENFWKIKNFQKEMQKKTKTEKQNTFKQAIYNILICKLLLITAGIRFNKIIFFFVTLLHIILIAKY